MPNDNLMPAEIAKVIAKIMREIEPAKRTEQGAEGDRKFNYASADDIYAAVQRRMGAEGLILEMLDDGFAEFVQLRDGPGLHIKLIPTFTLVRPVTIEDGEDGTKIEADEVIRYSNSAALLHIVVPIESGNSTAAGRTTAEKTYLRNLLKLPTVATAPGDVVDGQPIAAPSAAGIGRPAPHEIPIEDEGDGTARAPRRAANPLMLSPSASATERLTMTAAIGECATLAACDSWFKKNAVAWAKLKAADQVAVREALESRKAELGEVAA